MYVRMEQQRADFFTKSLDIRKVYKHKNTVLNVV